MKIGQASINDRRPAAVSVLIGAAVATVLLSTMAAAQAPAKPAPAAEEPGFFAAIGRWFDRQAASIRSTFEEAGSKVGDLGHEAGVAARTTASGAKEVGDAVTRIPNTRFVSGYEKCKLAPNGAPDCVAAANAVCKAKGFAGGSSLDMTTAEVCPPKVYMSGRSTGEGCHTETFVSRALCQ